MLSFKSYLRRRSRDIRSQLLQAEECFVSIDDPEARLLLDPTSKHFTGAVLLRDEDDLLMNFDCWDIIMWSTWIQALIDWERYGVTRINFADNGLHMEWIPQGEEHLLFRLTFPDRVYAEKVLPRREFLSTVLEGLIHFHEKLIEYGNQTERVRGTVEFLRQKR